MGRWSKRMKKYERHFLLAIVIILLISFSVTGAVQCTGEDQGKVIHWGGSFLVAPARREAVEDERIVSTWKRFDPFLWNVRSPSLTFPTGLMRQDVLRHAAGAWAHVATSEAAHQRGYQCGEEQLATAVRLAVQRSMQGLEVTDATYSDFLTNNWRRGAKTFQETVREVVLKDAFLQPLIDTQRFGVSYPEAYEVWKRFLLRVNVGYVALSGEDLALQALKLERTRERIGRQTKLLREVAETAKTLDELQEKVEAWRKDNDDAWPASLAEFVADGADGNPKDAWEREFRYQTTSDGADLRSAGPDGHFDSSDDVTPEVLKQLETRALLRDTLNDLLAWRRDRREWPATLEELEPAPTEGEDAPTEGEDAPATTTPTDAWGQVLVYTPQEEGHPQLASSGPDGVPGNADDVVAAVTVEANERMVGIVGLGGGLVSYLRDQDDEDLDAWERALRLDFADPMSWRWAVASAGPDGSFGTEDDVRDSNEGDLRRLYREAQAEFVEPVKRRYGAIFLHLPLMPDTALRSLWAKYPDFRPAESKAFNRWRTLHGETYYLADDPADPLIGHGADLAERLEASDRATFVPDVAIFGEAPDDIGPADSPDLATYLGSGWRPVMLRELFVDELVGKMHRQVLENSRAIAAWDTAKEAFDAGEGEDPGEKPAELTFEDVLQEHVGDALPAVGDAPWIGVYRSEEPLKRAEWEALPDIGGMMLNLHTQELRDPGAIADRVLVVNEIHTRAIVQNLEFLPERQMEFEDVYPTVFDRLVERTRLDLAKSKLEELRRLVERPPAPEEGDEGEDATTPDATWKRALKAWAADLGDVPHAVEETGWFVGARPPLAAAPDPESLTEPEMERRMRQDFVRQTGFNVIEAAVSDGRELEPGTLGVTLLTDEDLGTDSVYLVRLIDSAYPPPEAFSPRDYADFLVSEIYGGPKGGRSLGAAGGRDEVKGSVMEAMRRFFSDWSWLRDTFEFRTTPEIDKQLAEDEERGR